MANYNLRKGSLQYRFQACRTKVQIFAGAFANGKSSGLLVKGLKIAEAYPGSLGLMARATYPKLNGTLRRDFLKKWCPASWIAKRPTQDDNSCILKNGTEVHFRYISQKGKTQEDGTTTSNLLSATYDWIIVDQIEDPEIEYKDFLDLFGRLRGTTPYRPSGDEDATMPTSGPRWFLIGCNPTRNWFYTEVVKPFILFRDHRIKTEKLIVDKNGDPILDLFEGDTYSNSENLPDDFIEGLESTYKGQMRDRYLLGKWAAYEGLVYPTFDPSVHLLKRATVHAYLENCLSRHVRIQVLEAFDFGLTSPCCYLLAFIDDYGRVVVLDGFYEPNLSYDLIPDRIADIRGKYPELVFDDDERIKADPAIFRKQVVAKQLTGVSVSKLLTDLGLNLKPAQNDILPGIAKVTAYLGNKRGVPHIETGAVPSPMIMFADDLTFIQDEILAYYWKKNPLGVQIDEPMENKDHAMDTIKYALSDLPEPSQIVLPKEMLPPGYFFWQEMEVSDYQRRVTHTPRRMIR